MDHSLRNNVFFFPVRQSYPAAQAGFELAQDPPDSFSLVLQLQAYTTETSTSVYSFFLFLFFGQNIPGWT